MNFKESSEKNLMREAEKQLAIDTKLKLEFQENIEEEKLLEKMNKKSQKIFNSFCFKRATPEKIEKTKILEENQ